MHANKHEFGRRPFCVSATNSAQRTARPTKIARDDGVVAVFVSSTETSGPGVRRGERLYNYSTAP